MSCNVMSCHAIYNVTVQMLCRVNHFYLLHLIGVFYSSLTKMKRHLTLQRYGTCQFVPIHSLLHFNQLFSVYKSLSVAYLRVVYFWVCYAT